MFLKVIFKTKKSTGERIKNYRLGESYRYDILVCLNNSDFVFLGNQTTCYELPNTIRRKQIGGA